MWIFECLIFFQTGLKMYLWHIFTFICLKKVKVKFAQLSLTVYNPMDCTLLGSLPMEFSRPEYWSG